MFDLSMWANLARRMGASETTFDQCEEADDPKLSPKKPTVYMSSDNATTAVQAVFGPKQCSHGPGAHPALRGINPDGTYKTSAAATFTTGHNLSLMHCILIIVGGDTNRATMAAGEKG